MWQEIKNILFNKKDFLLTTHVNPDGDGIGSACALVELLLSLGKTVRVVTDSPIPEKFSFLDYHGLFHVYHPDDNFRGVEVLICVDTHRLERIGGMTALTSLPGLISICIDHHPVTETFSTYAAMDPKACSAGAMVYSLFKECGCELNLEAATGLYTSIICDTGRFSYSSTSRIAHKIADECIKLGVDPDLTHLPFQHVTMPEIRLFAKALEKMEFYLDNRVVIEQICREDCEKTGGKLLDLEHIDLDYIHEFNKLIEDVECAVLLRELSNQKVRVSIRSKSNFDIGHLMHQLGGGGHSKAAGVTLKGSLEEVKSRILHLLGELFAQGSRK